ncbi:hypothetical protein LV779_08945 [Streptomyces thinghirensis]|nr:hypothetical protein [Streptomyces thinghirensis]
MSTGKVLRSRTSPTTSPSSWTTWTSSARWSGASPCGGQIAMELQLRHPGGCGPSSCPTPPRPPRPPRAGGSATGWPTGLLAEGMDGYAHEVIGKMLAAYNVTAMPDVAARVLEMMCATDPRAPRAALRGRAERPDYRDVLAAVEVPVLDRRGRGRRLHPGGGGRVHPAPRPVLHPGRHRQGRSPAGCRATRALQRRAAGIPGRAAVIVGARRAHGE